MPATESPATPSEDPPQQEVWQASTEPGVPEPAPPQRKRSVAVIAVACIGILAIIAIGVMALKSDGDRDYPAAVRKNFLDACSPDAGTAVCTCILEELEEKYTLAEFVKLERRMESENDPPDELLEVAAGCVDPGQTT